MFTKKKKKKKKKKHLFKILKRTNVISAIRH
jgi:hypothetical protein